MLPFFNPILWTNNFAKTTPTSCKQNCNPWWFEHSVNIFSSIALHETCLYFYLDRLMIIGIFVEMNKWTTLRFQVAPELHNQVDAICRRRQPTQNKQYNRSNNVRNRYFESIQRPAINSPNQVDRTPRTITVNKSLVITWCRRRRRSWRKAPSARSALIGRGHNTG